MTPFHLPTAHDFSRWSERTPKNPLRILVSGCLSGLKCGYDATSYGEYPHIIKLMSLPNVKATTFCPEEFSFGTPRDLPDIHGGMGFDVLDGKAKVITDKGEDWTQGMIAGAERMLQVARENEIDLAVLTDMSAACGTQVISNGNRLLPSRAYQIGYGVCAALLVRNGFKAVSQRDFKTLHSLFRALDPNTTSALDPKDHHETDWYRDYFKRA
jgi:uncharacterized protein YbbK (DUF523 family)